MIGEEDREHDQGDQVARHHLPAGFERRDDGARRVAEGQAEQAREEVKGLRQGGSEERGQRAVQVEPAQRAIALVGVARRHALGLQPVSQV